MPQDLPPVGGYNAVQYKRNLPARGLRPAYLLLGMGALMTYGFWRVGQGIREQNELAREKMWSRIYLIPMLTAEEDRDLVRRHLADQAREKELLGKTTSAYNSDSDASGDFEIKGWMSGVAPGLSHKDTESKLLAVSRIVKAIRLREVTAQLEIVHDQVAKQRASGYVEENKAKVEILEENRELWLSLEDLALTPSDNTNSSPDVPSPHPLPITALVSQTPVLLTAAFSHQRPQVHSISS
ncbi:hypothetical protein VF21_07285 [Pseudogymnoascus sp. 05NY08]|nr:hypothetical protein VF21_07285 [Pseudogymnoascus sp. 05NY08]